jgi:hypothetical protein
MPSISGAQRGCHIGESRKPWACILATHAKRIYRYMSSPTKLLGAIASVGGTNGS